MEKTEPEPKLVRWIERTETEPQGADGVRHKLVRIVEGKNPPEGAALTEKEIHGWIEDKDGDA